MAWMLTFSDDPEKYRDAPVSLQLVGRRYDDEKVIQALEFLQRYVQLPFA
jgi:amidase